MSLLIISKHTKESKQRYLLLFWFPSKHKLSKIKTCLSTLVRVPRKLARPKFLVRCWRKFFSWKLHKVLKKRGRVSWHGRWNLNRSKISYKFLYETRSKSSTRPRGGWSSSIKSENEGNPRRLNSRRKTEKGGRGLNRSPPFQWIKRGNSVSSHATFADSWLVSRWQVKLVDTELTPDLCYEWLFRARLWPNIFTFGAFERFLQYPG